jgi:predicted acetyltransferase
VSELWVRLADETDLPVFERLWLMFRHDISEFGGQLPNPDGTFRSERLQAAFVDPGWEAYLLCDGDRPVGFAIVRGLASRVRVLTAFFVVRAVRRTGIGSRAVREVVGRHPGPWEVAFQDNNLAAVRFWRRVATEIAGDAWTEEHRPVPGQPGLPPDAWISFEVPTECSATSGSCGC